MDPVEETKALFVPQNAHIRRAEEAAGESLSYRQEIRRR